MTDMVNANAAVRELALEPGAAVEIFLSSGDLRVRGTDGDRVIVRSRDGVPLDDDLHIDAAPGILRIRDGETGIRIGPLHVRTRRSLDLDIDLPRTAAVSLRTMSGDVEATGIGGPSQWASASGDLRLATSAGPVRVDTMSGDATLEVSAAISLAARTVSGDLRVRAPRLEAVDASTTSGDVRIEADLAEGARHSISSVSGDVEVVTGSPVRLEAQTIAGDVRASGPHSAEGGRGRRTLVVGKGSVALSVRTTSGDVRLRVVGGRAASAPTSPIARTVPAPPVPPAVPVPPVARAAPEAPAAPQAPAAPKVPVAEAAFDVEPRPITDEDTQAWTAPGSAVDRHEAARLDVLRALERGDLDVETASRRLETLVEAGPRSFREWC